jgi:hypothetical protein
MAITKKDIDALTARINGDRKYPELGYYYAMGAYGGWKFVQIVNESGGVRDVFPRLGYCSKRDLYNALTSFIEGRDEACTLAHYGIK